MLLIGFSIGSRRSELVAIDLDDVVVTTDGLLVRVTRSKTRARADEIAVPWGSDPALCPVGGFRTFRQALSDRGVHDGPLFRPISRSDAVLQRRLSGEAVADILAGLAAAAGIPVPEGFRGWSGHSLRRGMATEARRAGADALRIARQGGWADGSTSLTRYLVDVDRFQDHALKGVL
jgi:integrase